MAMFELLRRLRYFVSRERYADELDEEMRLHLALRAEQLRASGMSVTDATRESRRRFGNVTGKTEESRDMWGFDLFDQFRQDLRFAARRLKQRPGFSIPVLGVIAIGIGATTAVFSAVDAAMLRSLPFTRPHELFTLTNVQLPIDVDPRGPGDARLLNTRDIAGMTEMFSAVAAYASGGLNLHDPERPQRVKVGVVTATFFPILGAQPMLGRTFSAEEGKPRGPLAVVLSHGLWRRQFGGSDILGKTIQLHGRSYAVVGVMPPGFTFPDDSDLWIPMTVPTTRATFDAFRGYLPSRVIARARPGISRDHIASQLMSRWHQSVAPATGEQRDMFKEWIDETTQKGPAIPLHRELLGDRRRALLTLLGTTGVLLLIACANVANLLLSDSANRQREIAVRAVLGATRRRIVRQLFAESLLLSLAGAVLGVMLAPAALRVLRLMLPISLTGVAPPQLDLRVLAFAVWLAVLTSLLFGLWPAIGATRHDASATIKSGGGHGATAGGMGRVRRALVVAEVGLTVMLLVAAGLMLRSFERLMSEDMGMNPEQVATLETSFSRSTPRAEALRIINGAIERLQGQPGIIAAGAVSDLPLRANGGISVTVDIPGAPPLKEGEYRMARNLYASGGYFSAMGIPLLRGRTFQASDAQGPDVAVISNTMAERYWPGQDPVGQYFSWRADTARITVIGVVADVREARLDVDPRPQMYGFIDASSPTNPAIVVRGSLPTSALIARLTEAMRTEEPSQAMYNVRMMDQVISASVTPRRTNTILISLFAALALVLSALGVYAVMAYGVAQRTREFGIRAALGATGWNIVSLVSREMLQVIVLGITIGLGAAWALSRVLAALLYEVDARDPATFVMVPLVLLLPAIIATVVPALRATRVNPSQVMRSD
jgi:putative ABC transport system permease protein